MSRSIGVMCWNLNINVIDIVHQQEHSQELDKWWDKKGGMGYRNPLVGSRGQRH